MPGGTGATGGIGGIGWTGPTTGYTGDTGGFDSWAESGGTGGNELWGDFTPIGMPANKAIPKGAVTAASEVPEGSTYYGLSQFADKTAKDWLDPSADRETMRWSPFRLLLGAWLDALLGLPNGTSIGATLKQIYTALSGLRDKADESFRSALQEKIANAGAEAIVRFEERLGLNLVLDGSFNGPNYKRFPLTDEQFSGYAIGEQHHSGAKSWKWYQYSGMKCGFQFAPTAQIKHIDVFEGEGYFAEAWIYPDSGNQTSPGAMQIGCVVTDSTGVLPDLETTTDSVTGLDCTYPFNGPDMVRGQWNKINISVEIPGPPEDYVGLATYDKAVFWVRSTANSHTNDSWWLDDVVLRHETLPARAQAEANVAEVIVNLKSKAGGNLVIDPSFNTTIARFPYNDDSVFARVSVLSGGQAHTGLASWKWVQETGADCGFIFNPTGKVDKYGVKEGEQYSMSAYVYSPSTNAGGGNMQIGATFTDSAGVLPLTYVYEDFPRSGITNNTWTQLETTVPVPAGYNTAQFWVIANSDTPANNVFYVDDVHLREISHPQNIIDKIHEAIVGAAPTTPQKTGTVATNLKNAWTSFWEGLANETASGSKLPSQVKSAGQLVNYNLGLTEAKAEGAKLGNQSTNNALFGQITPLSAILHGAVPNLSATKITTDRLATEVLPLGTGAVGSGFVMRNTTDSFSMSCSANTPTAVKFTTAFYDSSASGTSDYSLSTGGSGELKVTAANAGWYMVEVAFGIAQTARAVGYRLAAALFLNGSVHKIGSTVDYFGSASTQIPFSCQGSFIVYLNVGDYVTPGCMLYSQSTISSSAPSGTDMLAPNFNQDTYFSVSLLNRSLN